MCVCECGGGTCASTIVSIQVSCCWLEGCVLSNWQISTFGIEALFVLPCSNARTSIEPLKVVVMGESICVRPVVLQLE